MSSEIDRIAESANFNGIKLLNGDLGATKDKDVTGVKGSQAINTGIEVGKTVDGYGVTGEFSINIDGLMGDGDSITIKGTKGDGTALTAQNYGTPGSGEAAQAGEIKLFFGAGGIEGDTKEAQANALYQKLLTNTELTDSFDITVDGTKVNMKAKQEGAPSITGGGLQGIGNITDVSASNKAVSIATGNEDKAPSVSTSTNADGMLLNAKKLTNAGVNNLITAASDYQVGDILEFKFTVDGTDVSAKVELTEDMFAGGHLNTEDGTQAIVDALKDAKFADVEGTNIDESKYTVGDYFNIAANKNAGGFAEAGSLMIEGKKAGALTFAGVTKAGVAAGTSVNGTAGTNGTVTDGSTGATVTVKLKELTLTQAQRRAGVDLQFKAGTPGVDNVNIIAADAGAVGDKTYTKDELANIMREKIGKAFNTGTNTQVTLRDVTADGELIFEKTAADTASSLVDHTDGITVANIKFVEKGTDTAITGDIGINGMPTAAAGTPSTEAVSATATFKLTDGITGRTTTNAISLQIGTGGTALELVAANEGKANYTQEELLELISAKLGNNSMTDAGANAGTWKLESIGSDGTITLRQTANAATGKDINDTSMTNTDLGILVGTTNQTITDAAVAQGVSADDMMASTQPIDNRYHSVTKFGNEGDNATNFSLGDKFTMSGVLSDGTKFELELIAGTHFDLGATKADTLKNIQTVLKEGQNGSGTSLEAVNAKLTSIKDGVTKETTVSSKTLFGAGGEFTIYANQDNFAGRTGENGDFIVSSNKAGKVAGADNGIVGTSGGAIQIGITPADEAKVGFDGSAGSAQTAARTSIQFKQGVEYGSAMSFNGKVYEFVAKAEDISDTNNTAIVVEDLANASADDIAEKVKTALGQDFGDQYNFETINGKLNISSKEIGSQVTAPEIKLINGTEINTASYKFNPEDIKVGKQFTLNAQMNAEGKLEGGQTFEFYQKGAAPVEPKEGVTYIGMDFKDPEAMTSEKIAQAVKDAVESDTALNGKMSVNVEDDGSMTVSSKVIKDGKFEDGSFQMVVDGDGGGLTLQIGETSEDFQKVNVAIDKMDAKSLGIGDISVGKQPDAAAAIDKIKAAINTVSSTRGDLGAIQNRLEHTINNLGVTTENMTAAESRIRDTDMAKEMMEFTKNNILVQASQAMLAQANQLPQGVLQLLQ